MKLLRGCLKTHDFVNRLSMRRIAIRSISVSAMLVILAHAPAPSDPREGAFDDPGETHNRERPPTASDDATTTATSKPC
jgi:hypothetical protein